MNINIFGSTGTIGKNSLNIISSYFPNIKINLIVANKNYKEFLFQVKKYKPKYIHLNNNKALLRIKNEIPKKTKILYKQDLKEYLYSSQSDYTILSVSGYKSLNYLENIVINTNNLGLVSKEAIVSAGHLFKKKNIFKKTNIIPLDSEHYSLFSFFNNSKKINNIKKIIITASGGPFLNKKYSTLKNISFNEAIKHPKWKMGYKNSIDSATLVNKCLEIVEAKYLFDLSYDNLDILIHPEALVHSIIENNNFITNLIMFKNDMGVPILNFLKNNLNVKNINIPKYELKYFNSLNFRNVQNDIFPIYRYFLNIDKNKPSNIIKFNVGNEFAVNLFKKNLIKYTDIYRIIKKTVSLNLHSSLNNIEEIINYHEEIENTISSNFKLNI
tara:strand:+ start:320 stop:1474 length:1155 start_codon:yes stop_codon:yes gene_type:complete